MFLIKDETATDMKTFTANDIKNFFFTIQADGETLENDPETCFPTDIKIKKNGATVTSWSYNGEEKVKYEGGAIKYIANDDWHMTGHVFEYKCGPGQPVKTKPFSLKVRKISDYVTCSPAATTDKDYLDVKKFRTLGSWEWADTVPYRITEDYLLSYLKGCDLSKFDVKLTQLSTINDPYGFYE